MALYGRLALASFLLLAFAILLVRSDTVTVAPGNVTQQNSSPPRIDCRPACDIRCSKSWKLNMCKKLCAICCNKCNCVPDGPSVEAKAQCPCYANMKNPKGMNKCP